MGGHRGVMAAHIGHGGGSQGVMAGSRVVGGVMGASWGVGDAEVRGGVAVVGPGPPQGTLCMKTSALSWQLLASSYAGSVTQRLRTWRRRSFRYPYHSL